MISALLGWIAGLLPPVAPVRQVHNTLLVCGLRSCCVPGREGRASPERGSDECRDERGHDQPGENCNHQIQPGCGWNSPAETAGGLPCARGRKTWVYTRV